MATLFLIRHAEPGVRGTFLGQLDPPLSPSGQVQARRALSNLEVKAAYTNPLRRAQETATYVRSAQLVIVPELQEINFGKWTGKTWQQIQTGWPTLAQNAAVVAHGGVNAALASIIDGRSPLSFNQAYTEITSLEYRTD